MKKFLLLFLLGTCTTPIFSQKLYYLYFQTEGNQAFFLRMDNKVMSSNAAGYLILPRLVDSTYNFTIGFPQNKFPEQPFTLAIGQKDHGYVLKDFGAKGWGLFDLQTLAIIMNTGGGAILEKKTRNIDSGATAFTRILAKVSDDPSLLEKPEPEVVAVKEEKPVAPKVTEPSVIVETKTIIIEDNWQTTAVKKEPIVMKDTVVAKTEPVLKPVEDTKLVVKTEPVSEAKPDSVAVAVVTPKTEPVTEEKPVVKTEQVLVDTSIVVAERPAVAEPATNTQSTETVTEEQPYKTSVVKKQSESSTTEGFGLVFIDQINDSLTDTIRLLIPNPKPMAKLVTEPVKQPVEDAPKFLDFTASADSVSKAIVKDTVAIAAVITEEKPVNVVTPAETVVPAKTDSVVTSVVITEVRADTVKTKEPDAAVYSLSKNCNDQATDADFLKLRKRMAAVENNDDMISEAKKTFKTKCFSTVQIKNLSTLFLDELGKYHFFDEAYQYVSDPGNFPSLQAELKEEYYVNRFKAMLRG
ncbi:MAG: hypothetical protein IPP73_00025 [Chitinophagaceae bacterium]|nr:hypothetical protein [Chitinophagaceae bacterium]